MTKLLNVAAICGALIVALFAMSADAQLTSQQMACAQQCQQAGASCFDGSTPAEQGNKRSAKAKQCEDAEATCIRACSRK